MITILKSPEPVRPFDCPCHLLILRMFGGIIFIFPLMCRCGYQETLLFLEFKFMIYSSADWQLWEVANLSHLTGHAEETKTTKNWSWLLTHFCNHCGTYWHRGWLPVELFIVFTIGRMIGYFPGFGRSYFSCLFHCIILTLSWMLHIFFSAFVYWSW